MDVLMIKENYDELLSDAPLDWLVQEPKEVTSHWLPTDFGINEELIQHDSTYLTFAETNKKKGEPSGSPFL